MRADLLRDFRTAPLESLSDYARFATATTGIPDISFDLIEALIERLPELAGSELAFVANQLVGAVSRAKFGDFRRGFRTLLRLGSILFADGGTETGAALLG